MEQDDRTVEVKKLVKCLKPTDIENAYYEDALKYLVKVLDPKQPDYDLVLGLASFAAANHLSEKQEKKADGIIEFYADKGLFD